MEDFGGTYFLLAIAAFFVFRHYRVGNPVLAALVWPIVGAVLLVASLNKQRSAPPRRPSEPPSASASNKTIERPKYGLIETAERSKGTESEE